MAGEQSVWHDYVPAGKRVITEDGYVIVRCPGHPNTNKGKNGNYIYEHRLVMSNHLKRPLSKNEVVHHKNGDRSDNRIENLDLYTNASHMKMHIKKASSVHIEHFIQGRKLCVERRRKSRNMVPCACGCGQLIEQHDSKGRLRTYVRGHNQSGKHWKWREKDGI